MTTLNRFMDYLGSEDFWQEIDCESIYYKELVADNLSLASCHLNNLIRRSYRNTYLKELENKENEK